MKQRTSSRRRRGQIIQNQHKLLATLALTFVLLWAAAIAQHALQLWAQQQRLDHYGSWQAALYDTNPGLNGKLLQHQNLDAVGQMTDCGEIVNSAGLTLARVGSLDDTAKQLSRLAFVAGSYPRADDEVALEMSVLAGLGYSFDVGQQIALPITFTDSQGQQETQTYQFTLCGVLRSFSAGWNAADAGPVSGIVSQGFVDAAPGVRSYVELVHGNYARVQDASELSALLSPEGAFVLNSNAYPGWQWDLESLMENGLLVILAVILGLFLVACSIVTWLWGNRQRLQICSDVGATRRQLRRSLSKRYVRAARQAFAWISLPAAVLVLAGFAALCLAGIEITLFTLLPALALPAILCGALALAGWCVLQLCSRTGIVWAKVGQAAARPGKAALRRPVTSLAALARRRALARPKQRMAALGMDIAFCVFAFALVLASGSAVASANDQDIAWPYSFTWAASDPASGFDSEGVEQLARVEGVSRVVAASSPAGSWPVYTVTGVDYEQQTLTWDGIEQSGSPLVLDGAIQDVSVYGFADEAVLQDLAALADAPVSMGDLRRGQALLRVDGGTDGTLQPGDMVEINTPGGPVSVQVAGILTCECSLFNPQTELLARYSAVGTASVFFLKPELESLWGETMLYNDVRVYTQHLDTFELASTLVSRVPHTGDMMFDNVLESKTQRWQQANRRLLFYGLVLAMLLALYATLLYYTRSLSAARDRRDLALLHDLGVPARSLRRLAVVRDARRVLLILLAGFLIWLAGYFAYVIGLNLAPATRWSWQTVLDVVQMLVRTWPFGAIAAVLALVAACPPLVCRYQCRNDRLVP